MGRRTQEQCSERYNHLRPQLCTCGRLIWTHPNPRYTSFAHAPKNLSLEWWRALFTSRSTYDVTNYKQGEQTCLAI
jgi:hypothetical protein